MITEYKRRKDFRKAAIDRYTESIRTQEGRVSAALTNKDHEREGDTGTRL